MSDEPACNFCGCQDPETSREVGTHRGESGTIGLGICGVCMEAAQWHEERGGSRCVNCCTEHAKTIQIGTAGDPERPDSGWGVEVPLCRDCYNRTGGCVHMYESDVSFRARANILYDWDYQRRFALRRDGFSCQDCGVGDCRLHVHHIRPRSEGGTDHRENLVSLCPDCHADRHDRDACLLCGSITDYGATWLDRSGGGWAPFCGECSDYIKKNGTSQRCSICARLPEGRQKSDGVYWTPKVGRKPDVYTACDECRSELLLSRNWKGRFDYIEEELPDTHVDVAHWEGGSDE